MSEIQIKQEPTVEQQGPVQAREVTAQDLERVGLQLTELAGRLPLLRRFVRLADVEERFSGALSERAVPAEISDAVRQNSVVIEVRSRAEMRRIERVREILEGS